MTDRINHRAEALEDAADEIEAEYDRRSVVAVGAQYQYNSGVLDGLDIAEQVVRARAAKLRAADQTPPIPETRKP